MWFYKTTWSKDNVTLWARTHPGKLPSCKFGGHRSHRNGDINSYINSYKDTLEKSERTTSIQTGVPIHNSEVPDTTGKINKKKEETGNYKVLCVSRKRKKPVSNRIKLIFCVTTRLFDDVLSCNQETWSID